MEIRKVGFVGAGIMGAPMARHVLRAGFEVFVHSRTRSKTDVLVANGATWAAAPAALAQQCDAIITVVSDTPDVEQVYLGSDGICSSLKPGTLCIDMSTVSPDIARTVAAETAHHGCAFLDAPVSGGKTGAEAGTLAIMVGGDAKDLERAMPLFRAMGKTIVHCGPAGTGQLTKMCNQILCALNLLAVSEALTFASRVGLDPNTVLQVVSAGAAGSWALSNLGPKMIARDFKPMFMVDLQQKDLRITLQTALRESVPLPGTALVSQLLASNQAHGEGREGTQALIKTIERLGPDKRRQ